MYEEFGGVWIMAYTAIDDSEAYFQVQLYTGDGAANNAITLGGDTAMQPDLVWIKNRDQTDSHCLFDAVRTATKLISTNVSTAESTDTDTLDSFASDGFQVDADVKVNTNTEDYVAWCWKESATAGFDIVAYTGNGSAGLTVSHSLSAVPKLMIIKNRSGDYNWAVYHGANTSAPETESLFLDVTDATSDRLAEFNDTAPTSSIFTVGDGNSVNNSSETFIAYLFAEKQGFSKFGTYTSNGNADGTFTYLGFRPAYVLHKQVSTTGDWRSWNNKSSPINQMDNSLFPNTTAVEYDTDAVAVDFLSNGIKWRQTDLTNNNPSGGTFIYIAFAEAPFVNSKGVPCNAR